MTTIILACTQCQGKCCSCVAVFTAIFIQSAAVRLSRPVPLGQSSYILWSVSGAMALMSKALSLQWYGKSRGHALQLLGHSPWRLPEPNLRHSGSSCRHPAWGDHTIGPLCLTYWQIVWVKTRHHSTLRHLNWQGDGRRCSQPLTEAREL